PGTAGARWVCRAPPPGGRRRAGCPRDVRRRWAARRRPGPRRSRSALVGVVGRVVGQPLAEELLIGQVLLVVRGEAGLAGVEVDGDEVAPVALGRVEHGLDRRDAGGTDRGGRQAGVDARVVRVVGVVELGALRDPAGASHAVVDGGVHPDEAVAAAVLQPVLQHPGDLAAVLVAVDLVLDDRGAREHLVLVL